MNNSKSIETFNSRESPLEKDAMYILPAFSKPVTFRNYDSVKDTDSPRIHLAIFEDSYGRRFSLTQGQTVLLRRYISQTGEIRAD